jgi:hypothetical protein
MSSRGFAVAAIFAVGATSAAVQLANESLLVAVPDKEQITQWSRSMRSVSVCVSRLADRPCPTGMQ